MPSAVWEHFERPERGKDNPVCHHCGKSVKNKGGNTSNLMAHIKTKHFMVYSSLQKKICETLHAKYASKEKQHLMDITCFLDPRYKVWGSIPCPNK